MVAVGSYLPCQLREGSQRGRQDSNLIEKGCGEKTLGMMWEIIKKRQKHTMQILRREQQAPRKLVYEEITKTETGTRLERLYEQNGLLLFSSITTKATGGNGQFRPGTMLDHIKATQLLFEQLKNKLSH